MQCDGEMVRDMVLAASAETEYELRVSELTPDTSYRVQVSAENEIGQGPSATVDGRTRRPPPPPPTLDCEPEPTQLKLRSAYQDLYNV